ncbi:MAG: hypothetical protein CME67_03885 [Halobacteriovoraceae bacterium]|nr:hypothetical protein [Peredibacter sp.]MBJ00350.1 hypothetical protein [Halobacteriovoraceae bacterium]|tara:strand:- start:221 stop:421 length:201 start_codon:yes stop_codon:yes gene_type:complete
MAKQKELTAKQKEHNAAIKTFKASGEVENFYRYIADNNLRSEAYELMKVVLEKIAPSKKRSKRTLQ